MSAQRAAEPAPVRGIPSTVSTFPETMICTLLLLAFPAPAQTTDVVWTTETSALAAIGDQGAIDGDRALLLTEPDSSAPGNGPLRVLFLDRGPSGQWSETQAIELPLEAFGLDDGTVAIEGDVAAVLVQRTVSVSLFRLDTYIFTRDLAGTWDISATLSGGTSMSDVPVPTNIEINNGDVLIGDATLAGARVFRQAPATGFWVEVQAIPYPNAFFASQQALAVDDELMVFVDVFSDAQVFERDGTGIWNATGIINNPAGARIFGSAYATNGERIALTEIDQNTASPVLNIYHRPDPTAPGSWALEASVALPASFVSGLQFIGGNEATTHEIHFEGDVIVARETGCSPTEPGATPVTIRRDPMTGAWFYGAPLCGTPLAGAGGLRILDFDGTLALVGDRTADVGGALPGAVAFLPILDAEDDCDLDGIPDADQIAACFGCDVNGDGKLDACQPSIGFVGCTSMPVNASGQSGRLDAIGDAIVGGAPVAFRATQVTQNSFGLLISGSQFNGQPAALGNGFRCVAGPDLGRFSNQVSSTGPDGAFLTLVDPTDLPSPSGQIAIGAGTTWWFQGLFRDGDSVNLTNVVGVPFN